MRAHARKYLFSSFSGTTWVICLICKISWHANLLLALCDLCNYCCGSQFCSAVIRFPSVLFLFWSYGIFYFTLLCELSITCCNMKLSVNFWLHESLLTIRQCFNSFCSFIFFPVLHRLYFNFYIIYSFPSFCTYFMLLSASAHAL